MEFLEYLKPKSDGNKTTIGFILQGGFNEAHQLRTAEHYLEKLPSILNCKYTGTLIKGGMFFASRVQGKKKEEMLQPFYDMGKRYAKEGIFDKSEVSAFAGPENYSKSMIFVIHLFKPINKIAWRVMTKKFGVNGRLDERPYEI